MHFEHAECSSQALVPELALQAQLIVDAFQRVDVAARCDLFALRIEDGGVAGIGRPVVVDVVNQPDVRGDDPGFAA
ncbi:hypothetical protein D3C84_1273500 [compost metagenome]